MGILSAPAGDGRHECLLCPHRCTLRDGQAGICMARVGSPDGVYLAAYGKMTQAAVEPIEKKPLWHYRPNLRTLSLGGYGCSMSCDYCQNWMVSQRDRAHDAKTLSAADVVALAKNKNCGAVCFTYNEPIVYFEFVIDVANECRKNGLDVILKTNAYAAREPWLELIEHADALNIDWKGTNEQYRKVARADDSVIYPRMAECLDAGKHVEVSVPVYFDAKLADFEVLRDFLGPYPNTPIHLLKVFPANRIMLNPATPDRVLFRVREYLLERLNYVYIANVFSDPKLHSTSCKSCGKLLAEREALRSIVHMTTPCCEGCPITYENAKQRSVCSP